MKRFLPLVLALSSLAAPALAQTVYIGDTIYVPLRSGAGSEYRIVNRAVKTGTELKLLNKEKEKNYYHVQLPSGQQGYIPAQYILFEQPAAMQLATIKEENTKLTEQLKTSNEELEKVKADLTAQSENARSTEELTAELNQVKEISSKSLELDQKNTELRTKNEELIARLQTLETGDQQLLDGNKQLWFLYGGGTMLLGLLMGLIAPSLRNRRKSNTWV